MKKIIELLGQNPGVTDYKINVHKKESYELFYVGGKLETVRRTNTCDKGVTVYVDHGECKGESQFYVYPSTTDSQLAALIDEAVRKAKLINNKSYLLPGGETGEYAVQSNFPDYDAADLAEKIASCVFAANEVEHAALNSVEVFINKHTETVLNSNALHMTQVRYDAMVEAIPTYNGEKQSVELYEQYNFSSLDLNDLTREIAEQMAQVKARYEAVTPDHPLTGKVILHKLELAQLMWNIAGDLNYASVYSHSNLFNKGDAIQKAPAGDKISIIMAGQVEGSVRSSRFDSDGVTLGSIQIVEDGKAVNYYGSNRYGQYLGENPTGNLACMMVAPGTAGQEAFENCPYLEVISMSGLQVDFYSDYIGGEVRLAYYHDGTSKVPVTGLSISGKLSEVLDHIHLSGDIAIHNGYSGPRNAILDKMKIF